MRKYDLLNGLTVLLLAICILYLLYINYNEKNSQKDATDARFIKLILHIYFIFALVGNHLFMSEKLMNFGLAEFGSFIVMLLALWPFEIILMLIFNKCTLYFSKTNEGITDSKTRTVRIVSFAITFGLLIIMSLAFFPAIMSTDGVAHWTQAIGYYRILNNSPAAFTLFVKLCSILYKSPYSYIVIQILLFSLVSSRVMIYFYKKGMPIKIIYCMSAFIAILPNNYMTLSTLSKNPMYTILCIWVSYLLFELIDAPEKAGMSIKYIVKMSIALPCLYLCRYNSFIAVYGVCAILIIICIKHFKIIKLRLGIPVLATIFIVKIVTGPIYTYFDVAPNNSSGGVTYPLISPLAVAYNNGVELTEDTLEYMSRIRPLEYWNQHIPYHGDYFAYSEPKPQYDQINGYHERFKHYFILLFSRPDIVIKDRLDAIESLWNIFPSKGQGAYNERYHLGINSNMPQELLPMGWNVTEINRWSAYHNETDCTTIPYALCQFSESYKLLDSLIWRSGFSIVLVFYAMYYAYTKGKRKTLVAAIPMLGTLITLILAISWQLYQYFWVIHIISCLLIIYFILPVKEK